MARDPVDARRDLLIADGLDAALEIEAARPVWPSLVATGIDPQRMADDLRTLSEQAQSAVSAAKLAVLDAGRPHAAAQPVLASARAWQKRVRQLLRSRLPTGPAAALAAADLRAALRPTAHRLAGACTMLRSAVEILKACEAELGAEVAEARTAAVELLARLEAIQHQDYDARLTRLKRTSEAAALVEELRRRVREVRRELALARAATGAYLPVVTLTRARADVARRPKRTKKTDED